MWQHIFLHNKRIFFSYTDLTGHSIISTELGEGIYQYLNIIPIRIKIFLYKYVSMYAYVYYGLKINIFLIILQ